MTPARPMSAAYPWEPGASVSYVTRQASSPVDEPAVGGARGFHDGLGEGRVGGDAAAHLWVAALEVVGHDQLLNHVRRLNADDVRAEQLAVLLVADDLDLA